MATSLPGRFWGRTRSLGFRTHRLKGFLVHLCLRCCKVDMVLVFLRFLFLCSLFFFPFFLISSLLSYFILGGHKFRISYIPAYPPPGLVAIYLFAGPAWKKGTS